MDEQTGLWAADGRGEIKTEAQSKPGRVPVSLAVRVAAATGAVALIAGILVGPIVAGRPTPALGADGQPVEHTIAVSGVGVVSVTPDLGDLMIGVTADRGTAKEARNAAAQTMAAVLAAIKKNGVADKDIVTVNVGLEPVYEYNNGGAPRLVGQRFTNTVRVTVRNLDTLPSVVDDTVAAGATVVGGISFRVADPKGPQAQARDQAMRDARAKADALAQSAGVSIKGVASVSESSYTPGPISMPYAGGKADMQSLAPTPIQTGTTDVQVQVQVTYLIG